MEQRQKARTSGRLSGCRVAQSDARAASTRTCSPLAAAHWSRHRCIHFSDRYADYDPARIPDRVDLRILPNGEVSIAGFLTAERVVELANALGARRSMRA
jgi:hypothetical protein